MSYTPTQWGTGDTITASALNKIEQGIAGSGGGFPYCEVTTTDFPSSSSNVVGYYSIYKKNGNTYEPVVSVSSLGTTLYVFGNVTSQWACLFAPVPHIDNRHLFFSPGSGVTVTATSGGIASDPVLINGGSYYEVTGDFTITLKGWA